MVRCLLDEGADLYDLFQSGEPGEDPISLSEIAERYSADEAAFVLRSWMSDEDAA